MSTEQTFSTRDLVGGAETAPRDEERIDESPFQRDGDETRARVDDTRTDETRARTDDTQARVAETRTPDTTADVASDDTPSLLSTEDNGEFQRRWESIQTGFVDEPRQTVEQADELVAQVMKRLAEGFATERERLEGHWGRGEDVSTEDLRVTLQRYRAFFQRLLQA
jgi:hypothetical protein